MVLPSGCSLQQATTLGVLTISPPPALHSKILSLAWSREIGVRVAAIASLLSAANPRRRMAVRATHAKLRYLLRAVPVCRKFELFI
jgi:hypothetical protein